MFKGMPDAALARLDSRMVEAEVDAGDTLMRESDFGRQAFIVADGIAEVQIEGQTIGLVGHGDLIGELSLLTGATRAATVVAVTPMRLYVLDPRQFNALFEEPQCARWIATSLASRRGAVRSMPGQTTTAPATTGRRWGIRHAIPESAEKFGR